MVTIVPGEPEVGVILDITGLYCATWRPASAVRATGVSNSKAIDAKTAIDRKRLEIMIATPFLLDAGMRDKLVHDYFGAVLRVKLCLQQLCFRCVCIHVAIPKKKKILPRLIRILSPVLILAYYGRVCIRR
jgi:hypothetical protein